jgi:hypothetical protein
MAVTTQPYTNADLTAIVPQIWTAIINEALFPEFVLQNFVTDLSSYVDDGGRVCHVPQIYTNIFTVSTQTVQGAEINTQSRAVVDVTLSVTNHRYIAWIIGDMDLNQIATKYSLNEKYAMQAAKLLKQELEDSLFALESSFTATELGSAALALDDLSIRQAISYMDTANFNLTECAFFFLPSVYWNQIAGLSKFAPNYASNLNLVATGTLGGGSVNSQSKGKLYGQTVYTSPRVSVATLVAQNIFVHPDAFGFATQTKGGNKVRVQMEAQLRNLGLLAVVDMVYGVGMLRADAGVTLRALASATVA